MDAHNCIDLAIRCVQVHGYDHIHTCIHAYLLTSIEILVCMHANAHVHAPTRIMMNWILEA